MYISQSIKNCYYQNTVSSIKKYNSNNEKDDYFIPVGKPKFQFKKNVTKEILKKKNVTKEIPKNKNIRIDKDTGIVLRSYISEFYGTKPFKCEYCGFSFKRKHDLIRHTRLHTGVKPYKCDFCQKAFYRSDALKRHMRVNPDCSLIFGIKTK